MTIGQRIAQRRKLLGLSQEALGDKLGVSRQAISKWEADAALPEIDKLIALSKLFDVTVGWLLGVEDAPRQEQEPLTEEQLSAMEQLIKLYAAPAQPEPEKKSKAPLFLSILALILAMATAISCLTNHNQMSSSVAGLFHQVSTLQNGYDSVRARINDLETAATAPGTPDALHSFDFQLTPGTEEPNVHVHLSAIPKRHTDETAVFSVRRDGREVTSTECIWDGTAYVGQLELPLENGYAYWLLLYDLQGNQEQIPLQDTQAQDLKNTFSLTCTINTEDVFMHYVGEDLCLSALQFTLQRPISMEDGNDYRWEDVSVVIYRNGEEVTRNTFISENDRLDLRRSVGYDFSGALSFHEPRVILEDGDGIEVWLIASVSNGMECMEMIGSWRYEQTGDAAYFLNQ